jgi:hypothetical protein
MKYIDTKCIVCERIFIRREVRHKGKSSCNSARGKNCITCSKQCSKVYNRIAQKIRSKNDKRKR